MPTTNADQANNELRPMKAKPLHGLEHIHLMFVFQPFPNATHRHKQTALRHAVPAVTRQPITS